VRLAANAASFVASCSYGQCYLTYVFASSHRGLVFNRAARWLFLQEKMAVLAQKEAMIDFLSLYDSLLTNSDFYL